MLEESGTVVAIQGDWAWVETAPRSACSQCGSGSCSTSAVAKLFGTRRNRFRLHNNLAATPGDRVVIGIPDQVLVAVSVKAYLVPLLTMVLAVALVDRLGASEIVQTAVGLLGLLGGLAVMGRVSRQGATGEGLSPRLLRRSMSPSPHIELNELTGSTP